MGETNLDKKGILLETGTNEFEIVEFNIGNVNYGINVAKVREVITAAAFPVTHMPQAHPYVDGLFTLRGRAMPLVNLARCLNVAGDDRPKNIIVTEINNYNLGFLVDNVSRIHRISWKDMEPSPEVGDQSRVVGIIKMEDKIVLLIDFETIIAEINPEINAKLTTVEDADHDLKLRRGGLISSWPRTPRCSESFWSPPFMKLAMSTSRISTTERPPGITWRSWPGEMGTSRIRSVSLSATSRCPRWMATAC